MIPGFKPMLAASGSMELSHLLPGQNYVHSAKIDGMRATNVGDGQFVTRSLKDVPNRALVELFGRPEFAMLDGELVVGAPNHPNVFNKTVRVCKSSSVGISEVVFHVFDSLKDPTLPYLSTSGNCRWHEVMRTIESLPEELSRLVAIADTMPVAFDPEEFEAAEQSLLDRGFEGIMVRNTALPYLFARATYSPKRQALMRRKPLESAEAEILGFECSYENTNEVFTNELGRTARSTRREGLIPKDTLGRLRLRDVETGQVFWCGIFKGWDAAQLAELWAIRDTLPGQYVTYLRFPIGVVDLPRHPRIDGIKGIRPTFDMDAK